jgi:hypothetical protein
MKIWLSYNLIENPKRQIPNHNDKRIQPGLFLPECNSLLLPQWTEIV